MKIPNWLKSYIGTAGILRIEDAIKEVEKKTSAELVPVIVRRSSTVGHVPMMLFMFYGLLFLSFDVHGYVIRYVDLGSWVWFLYAFIGACISYFAAKFSFVQRLCINKEDQLKQVEIRAQLEFYRSHVQQTSGSTGILFFVSLLERRAVVLADHSIAAKLPVETWEEIVGIMIGGIKVFDLAQGMVGAIRQSGELLAPLFPIASNDRNELPNHVIIWED